jgi:hypothetical protein
LDDQRLTADDRGPTITRNHLGPSGDNRRTGIDVAVAL